VVGLVVRAARVRGAGVREAQARLAGRARLVVVAGGPRSLRVRR